MFLFPRKVASVLRPIRRIERRMETKPLQHLLHLTGEIALWSGATLMLAPSTVGTLTVYQAMLGIYHLSLGYSVHRHIFHYELKKARHETWPFRKLWFLLITGHGGLLWLTAHSYWFSFALAVVLPPVGRWLLTRPLPQEFERGVKLTTVHRVREKHEEKRGPTDPGFPFGGVRLSSHEMTTHTSIIGSTRSGKTNVMRLAMQVVLPYSFPGMERRSLIADFKPEFYPLLIAWGIPKEEISILNCSDARGCCWLLYRDFRNYIDCKMLGQIVIRERKNQGQGKIFDEVARLIVSRMAMLFTKYAPDAWLLRDFVLALENDEVYVTLLSLDREFAPVIKSMGTDETYASMVATISSYIEPLREIAAYMDHHHQEGRMWSITGWHQGHSHALIGYDRETEAMVKPLYTLLVTRAFQMLTSRQADGYSFCFLDELPELGAIGGLERVMRLAAAYRVCIVLAFQAITDLEEVYGANIANSVIGQCDKKAFLRVLDRQSAKWCSEQIGETEYTKKDITFEAGPSFTRRTARAGKATSMAESEKVKALIMPEEFMTLKKPDLATRTGIGGVYKVGEDVYRYEVTSRHLSEQMIPADDTVPAYIPIARQHQILRRWDRADWMRLGFDKLFAQANLSPEALHGTPFEGLLGPSEGAIEIEPLDFGFADDTAIDAELDEASDIDDSDDVGGFDT